MLVRRLGPGAGDHDLRLTGARVVPDELCDPELLEAHAAVRRRELRHGGIVVERDAPRGEEPGDLGRLGMAVEMRRKAGDGEGSLGRAGAAGAAARRLVIAIQAAQSGARRAAKRPRLL